MNELLSKFGTSQNLLTNKKTIYGFMTITGLWKNLGWDAIIYLACNTSIDPTLYEAASIDGAGYFKKHSYNSAGHYAYLYCSAFAGRCCSSNNDMDKLYAFQNKLIFNQVETLEMYTYNRGIKNYDYSYSTAVGIFQSTVSLVLLFVTNWIAKKIRGSSII